MHKLYLKKLCVVSLKKNHLNSMLYKYCQPAVLQTCGSGPHQFGKLYWDPDQYQSKNSGAVKARREPMRAVDARKRGMEAHNGAVDSLYTSYRWLASFD